MSRTFRYAYTDTFGGEPNYSWYQSGTIVMPELTYYGYDGSHGYDRARLIHDRELVRRVKAAIKLTGVRCSREEYGDTIELRPHGNCAVVFIDYCEE